VDPKKIKKIVKECYCNNVSSEQNELMYEEMASLLGMYAYTKDKTNIKPYIIIGSDV
jgi:hypothetical protein